MNPIVFNVLVTLCLLRGCRETSLGLHHTLWVLAFWVSLGTLWAQAAAALLPMP
jgi:hypothetical protein